MATQKVNKIDANGEQTTYIYDNKLTTRLQLANCVVQEHFNIRNIFAAVKHAPFALAPAYEKKLQEVLTQITQSPRFYIWHDTASNIAYCARITQ